MGEFTDEELDFARGLMAKWREPRSIEHHSPSSAKACLRQQMLTWNGYKGEEVDDPFLKSIFDDGNWRHLRWHTIFKRMGRAGLLNVAHIEQRIVYTPWLMGGTPDDVLDIPRPEGAVRVVVDIKGVNADKFKWIRQNNKPVDGHEWQLHDYMVGLRLGQGILWYENKNTQEYCEIPVHRNRAMVQELRKRYAILKESRRSGILPEHGCTMEPKDQTFRRCRQRLNCLKLTQEGY